MLLVLPIYRNEAHLIPVMEKAFELSTPGAGHSLLVACGPNDSDLASELTSKLGKHFTNTSHLIFDLQNQMGWPKAMNYAFSQIAHAVRNVLGPTDAWMLGEMDMTPVQNGWLDTIQSEYYADYGRPMDRFPSHRKFMGASSPTMASLNGEVVSSTQAGRHMAACGVYPSQAIFILKSIGGVNSVNKPYYEFLQWQIGASFQETTLVQNNRKTGNYRVEGNQIVCDSFANWAYDIHFNNPVSAEAMVVHGCQDGTLVEAIAQCRPKLHRPAITPPSTPKAPAKSSAPLNLYAVQNFSNQSDFQEPELVASPKYASMPAVEVQPAPAIQPIQSAPATSLQDRFEEMIWKHQQEAAKKEAPTEPAEQPSIPPPVPEKIFLPQPTTGDKLRDSWTPERRAKQREVMLRNQAVRRAKKEARLARKAEREAAKAAAAV